MRYRLSSLPALVVCAMTPSGHDSITAAAEWCRRATPEELAAFGLPYHPLLGRYRVPSEKTLRSVLGRLDPGEIGAAGYGYLRPLPPGRPCRPEPVMPDGGAEREQRRAHGALRMSFRLKAITREDHLDFVRARPTVSHMQVPSWGDVKPDWRAESLGWFDGSGRLVGVGLVLLRPLPKLKRYLAYLPEGPVIDWAAPDLERWLEPMLTHLKGRGAFSVKMGPPVVVRRWGAEAVKAAIADPRARRLRDAEATVHEPRAFDIADRLRRMGWQQSEPGGEDGFAAGQPRYVFQVPFTGRSLDEVQQGLSQQWRRNIRKAEKAGVKVVQGGYKELAAFYEICVETAERDRFSPRPLTYFQRMWTVLRAEHPDRMRLYLAHHEGEVLAAATMLTVGEHVWYSYGASTSRRREVQPNNAIQRRMMADAHGLGAAVYDLRGITDTLEESNHLLGLLRFKIGTGGEAVEYLGEWDYPLNKALHKALDLYMSRR